MCIRDRGGTDVQWAPTVDYFCNIFLPALERFGAKVSLKLCLLYTSDAADDLLCVDLGGRRIIKKKTK